MIWRTTKMNIVICNGCGFAIGTCICGKKRPEVIQGYRDNPKLIALLDKIDLAKKILKE